MSLKDITTKTTNALLDFTIGVLIYCHPEWSPRRWSNTEIRKFGPLFSGNILNLSGWTDGDKDGGNYIDYFPNANSYTLSNYGVEVGSSSLPEVELDLSVPYNGNLGEFDLVFNHTVIEHVHPTTVVFENLCKLSRDTIMTVVPFAQQFHGVEGDFTDYYRYSPIALEKLFNEHGFKTMYVSWNNDHPLLNTYLFHVASCCPDKYSGVFPKSENLIFKESGPGISWGQLLYPENHEKRFWRKVGEFIGNTVKSY